MNQFNSQRDLDIYEQDREIFNLIDQELIREHSKIQLIASENYVSNAVLAAQGSILTNKYAEGYPKKRFYNGCEVVDEIEIIAIERLKKLFGANFANVQPHSGSQANQAVYLALLNPNDTILGMSLDCGGHLTHGSKANLSGKWFNIASYGVDKKTYLIDYNEVEEAAKKHKPKMIIAGFSAYSRNLDFAKFREIADSVGAYLMADVAHIAGIIASGFHQNPLEYAHVVTSTTHKTLRGPRGGVIMTNHEDIAKKIDSAVFPGLQGGPLMHVIAAKAVAFGEALRPEFKNYINQVLTNAKVLASELINNDIDVLTGGTENHMALVDLRKYNLTGKDVGIALEKVGIICNKNSIPFDTTSPFITSGVRLGTPAATTSGCGEHEFRIIGDVIVNVIKNFKDLNDSLIKKLSLDIQNITKQLKVY